jgi:hypothetical protein
VELNLKLTVTEKGCMKGAQLVVDLRRILPNNVDEAWKSIYVKWN